MQTIPVVVVGLGQWGSLWLADIQSDPNYELAAVVDSCAESVQKACALFGLPPGRGFTSLEAAIAHTPPGMAVITVPPEHHFPVAEALMAAGFHILSEKPLANSVAEALALQDAAKKQGVNFMVSQDYRWQPPVQTLRKQIQSGTIGDLGYAAYRHFQALRIGGWREEMEHVILEDMAIHHFDLLRAITGLNCLGVYAESFNPSWSWYRGGAVTMVQLAFEKEFRVSYLGTWVTSGPQDSWPGEVRIEGSRGALSMNAKGEIFSHCGEETQRVPHVPMQVTGRQYALVELHRALTTGTPAETSIADNLQSYATTRAALLSVRLQRPVTIAEVLER